MAALAAGSSVTSVHLGLASHHHVFCPEHERFEDEGAAPRPTSRRPGLAAPAAAERRHVACAFANQLLRPFVLVPAAPIPSAALAHATALPVTRAAAHPRLTALQLAPKHSPPITGSIAPS